MFATGTDVGFTIVVGIGYQRGGLARFSGFRFALLLSGKIFGLFLFVPFARLSRSTIYQLISRNLFPRPVHISERAVAWSSQVVQTWIEEKIKGSA